MKKLLFSVRKHSGGTTGRSPRYQGYIKLNGRVSYQRFVAQLAKDLRIDAMDVDYIFSKAGKRVIDTVRSGKSVSLDWLVVTPVLKGSFDKLDSRFDLDKNRLVIVTYTRDPVRDCIADVSPQNVLPTLKASILSVMDTVACEESVLTVPSTVLVAGLGIGIDSANPDEGVALVNASGEVVATPTVLANTPSSMDLAFDALPEDGEYTLEIKARSGESFDRLPAVARRTVVVRKSAA